MQLVYLWVAEYKNIKNQGFNFSPDFECKYDKKSNELKIEPKKHTRIFPNNINVTAIVGENGSGKSGLLELIKESKIFTDIYAPVQYVKVFKQDDKLRIIGTIYGLRNNKDLIYCYVNAFPPKELNKQHQKIINDIHSNIYLYKYSLDIDEKSFVDYPNKKLSIEDIAFEDKKMILEYIRDNKEHNDNFGNYFKPDKCEIRLTKDISDRINELKNSYKNLPRLNNKHPFIKQIYQYIMLILNSTSLNKPLNNITTDDKLETYIKNFLENKDEKDESQIIEIKKLLKYIEDLNCLSENIASENEFHSIFKVNTSFILNNFFVLKDLPDCFNIDFKDTKNHISYNNLSSGEKSTLRIRFYIEKNISKSHIILLDEPETDLHPNWQKKLLHYLIETFKNRKQNIHFILTTHSPFLLSDLPKENIIFLKNGEQIYPDIETFGANIHTLLSHGFFMDDGLMGEFAKSQIDDVIKLLNYSGVLSENEVKKCKHIISITGEPILKRQLQKMLDSKNIDYIANDVKKEIKLLQHRILLLSKRL